MDSNRIFLLETLNKTTIQIEIIDFDDLCNTPLYFKEESLIMNRHGLFMLSDPVLFFDSSKDNARKMTLF